jgi:hypothetical protein
MECLLEYGQMDLFQYTGEKKINKRHGYGTQMFKSGFKFTGKWQNDLPEGYGILILKEIISYEGESKHLNLIQGIFKKGRLLSGVIRYSTGANFKGKLDENGIFKEGVFNFHDGDFYRFKCNKGQLVKGLFWKQNEHKIIKVKPHEDTYVYDSNQDKNKVGYQYQ